MTQFIAQNLAPIMFAGLFVFLLLGFPVAFSLGACGLFFGFIGIELGVLPPSLLQGLSELVKRIAFLRGLIPDPTVKIVPRTPEEELAEEIRRQAERDVRPV